MPLPSSSLVLLDGSTGHELKARGVLASFEGAMLANLRQPDVVTAIHAEYVDAGCDIVTTNTFTLTPDELAREVAFTLSNLAAGTQRQMRATLRAGVLPGLVHMMEPFVEEASERNARNFRGEEAPPPFWPKTNWAAVALANVLLRGTPPQRQRAVRAGCDLLCS